MTRTRSWGTTQTEKKTPPPTAKTYAQEEGARQADSAGQRGNIIDVLLKDSSEGGEDTATKREPGEIVRINFNVYNETDYDEQYVSDGEVNEEEQLNCGIPKVGGPPFPQDVPDGKVKEE